MSSFLKKLKERLLSDITSLRDTPTENDIFARVFVWFSCVSERKCSQAPTSLDLQKINSVDDVETIAYKVNEILLKAG